MKILKNKTYQKLLSNLEAKDRANKTWQEMYKSVSEAKQNAELKLASKEKECVNLMEQLKSAEDKLSVLTQATSACCAGSKTPETSSPSKKRSKK